MFSIGKLIRYWWKNWHKQMERYTMFLDRNNHYYQNDYTTQSNLQIQCNLYQTANGIFMHLEQKKVLKFIWKCWRPQNQSNLEKKSRASWRNQALWLQTMLCSCSHQPVCGCMYTYNWITLLFIWNQ